ncbi:MAG: hypothetical protein E6848_16720, partial [Bradyrhizobium sp.]|nr:hypothetical protein [Bradyrhizobium sp.]
MLHQPIRKLALILACAVAGAPPLFAGEPGSAIASRDALAQMASSDAIAEYRRKLAEYQQARAEFEQEAGAYWKAIADKRRLRNAKRRDRQPIGLDDYVLEQPPVYSGPKRPVNPEPEPEGEPRERKYIPV